MEAAPVDVEDDHDDDGQQVWNGDHHVVPSAGILQVAKSKTSNCDGKRLRLGVLT